MASIDEFFRNMVPGIGYDIPSDERNAVSYIQSLLHQLESYIEDFRAALELYDYCEADPKNTPFRWPWIALRDGAMTLYHFKMTMKEIKDSFHLAPSLKSQVDHEARRITEKLFDSYFPQWERLRHAVAHSAESSHSALKNQSGVTILHSRAGRQYITDNQGYRLSYELSEENLRKLDSIKKKFFASFDQVNTNIRKQASNPESTKST